MCANIDLFNRCTVAIFGVLYSAFPVPVTMKSEDVAKVIGLDSFDQSSMAIYAETVIFLRDEGYLTLTSEAGRGSQARIFTGVRLTSKGLAALNRTPKELIDAPSIGERIAAWTSDLVKEVSSDALKGTIKSLLSPF
ncbi:MAG: hypothetical protein RBR42_05035 [Desulfomicrobium sp.]|nr:hypothetical protein [Desulfomicrobium sp.]